MSGSAGAQAVPIWERKYSVQVKQTERRRRRRRQSIAEHSQNSRAPDSYYQPVWTLSKLPIIHRPGLLALCHCIETSM